MQLTPYIEALESDLAAMAAMGDEQVAAAAERLAQALRASFGLRLLDLLGEAALEVSGTANDFGVSLRSDGKVTAGTGNTDTTIASSTSGFNNGSWHHAVFTRLKSTGALKLYVDNVQVGSATGNALSLTAPTKLDFGRILTGTFLYSGSIDEVALYSSVLSSTTVSDHYHSGHGS